MFIRNMQKVVVQVSLARFEQYYGSWEEAPAEEHSMPPSEVGGELEIEMKTLEPTKWPARATWFETHTGEEVIFTYDQPVVITVKRPSEAFVEAFLISPFSKVTIEAGIEHGWVLALTDNETRICVLYPLEHQESFLDLDDDPWSVPTIVLPKELGIEQGEIPAAIW